MTQRSEELALLAWPTAVVFKWMARILIINLTIGLSFDKNCVVDLDVYFHVATSRLMRLLVRARCAQNADSRSDCWSSERFSRSSKPVARVECPIDQKGGAMDSRVPNCAAKANCACGQHRREKLCRILERQHKRAQQSRLAASTHNNNNNRSTHF